MLDRLVPSEDLTRQWWSRYDAREKNLRLRGWLNTMWWPWQQVSDIDWQFLVKREKLEDYEKVPRQVNASPDPNKTRTNYLVWLCQQQA